MVVICVGSAPGSGKSAISEYLRNCIGEDSCQHITDYEMLQELSENPEYYNCFEYLPPEEYEGKSGFKVLVQEMYSLALKGLITKAMNVSAQESKVVIIEFARENYMKAFDQLLGTNRQLSKTDIQWQEDIRKFLWNSTFIFLEADVNTCIARVEKRVQNSERRNNHPVPAEKIQAYYALPPEKHKENLTRLEDYLWKNFHSQLEKIPNGKDDSLEVTQAKAWSIVNDKLVKASFVPLSRKQTSVSEVGELVLTH